MKNPLVTLVILITLSSCTSQRRVVTESQINSTLMYCGDYVDRIHKVERKFLSEFDVTYVITTRDTIAFSGYLDLRLCPGDKCYLQYFRHHLSGSYQDAYIRYFTWEGSEDYYMLRQNWITGEVY